MQSVLFLLLIPLLAVYIYTKLKYVRFKQYSEFPQLKPSLVWGHMRALYEVMKRGHLDRHFDLVINEIREELGNPPVLFLDLRPGFAMCVACDHEVAEQISKVSKKFPWSVNKSPTMGALKPLTGPKSIITTEGEDWKRLRKRFNPGFAPGHLFSLLPCILDKTSVFIENLDGFAKTGEEFHLNELCVNLTFDIIGSVTMDVDLDAQLDKSRQNQIIRLFRELSGTYRGLSGRLWNLSKVKTYLRRRNLSKRLDVLLKECVKQKYGELKYVKSCGGTSEFEKDAKRKSRSILALTLQDTDHLTPDILSYTCDQLRTFLFAGHDTTSILLQWIFYELSRTPRALNAVRAEHDEVFGPDPDPKIVREKLLIHGEDLMRRLHYTSAVIKETLRLYPPAGTARMAPKGSGFNVRLPDGRELCLDGMVLYNCATVIHRDPAVYGETRNDWVPERWLGNTDTSMETNVEIEEKEKLDGLRGAGSRVPRSAWRPFERGPRNCIGQELANLEARVILACAARRYDFTKVGLGEVARDELGNPILNDKGQYEVTSVLYNTQQVTAQPVDGTRMKVRLAV